MNFPLPGCSLRALLGALCLTCAVSLPGQEAKPDAAAEQTKTAITKLLNDFLTFNSDPAQHDRFWANDLVYTTSGGLVKTKPMIMQAFADAAKPGAPKPEPRAAYSAEDVLVRPYGDTAALTFRLVARNADGTVATFRNSGTLLRRNGQWQVVTWQATKEPAGAPAAEATYQLVENWAQLPAGTKWAMMTAVDIDSKGTIYVLQRGEPAEVMVFDPAGKLLRTWGEKTFPNAHGLRVDRQDNIWITDRKLQQVLKFSPTGELLLALGQKGVTGDNNSTTALNGPSDLVFAPNGDIFVSDGESTNTRIVKYSADGKLIKFWGTKGSGPGQLDVPHSIVMDSKGRLLVADRSNKRIEIFDQDGEYIGVMTNVGTPYGLFMTKDDVLYVTDGTQGKDDLTIIDTKSQKVLGHFGGLVGPHMLAVDSSGAIYVTESRGASVKKFVRK